jgi:lipopolysaccharide export system permease protein
LFFTLWDGNNYAEDLTTYANMQKRPLVRISFKEEFRRFDLTAFAFSKTNEDLYKNHFQMLNLKQLNLAEDTLKMALTDKKQKYYELYLTRLNFFNYHYDSITKYKTDTLPILKKDLLADLDPNAKNQIVNSAVQSARNSKTEVDFLSIDYKDNEEYIRRFDIEWQRKFTLSFACLILFFIGAPLGAIIRKGGFGLPVVMSVLFFVIFHIISMIGEKSSREGILGAFEGMWLSSLVFLPIGLLLTIKATTDSPLFDTDVWMRFIKKIFRKT